MKIHHVGIFVKKIKLFEDLFLQKFKIISSTKILLDKNLGVKIKFIKFKGSNQLFEIVEPYGVENPITKVIKTKNNIINHLAFLSSEFEKDIDYLVKNNFYPISKILKSKYFKSEITFLMSPFNFIVEIIKNDNDRTFKK